MVAGVIAGLAALLAIWVAAGLIPTMGIEMPQYQVVERDDEYEVRQYEPYVVAEVMVEGGHKEAMSRGFRTLFDYISGANTGRQKISMTAPVLRDKPASEKISMTAPVLQITEGRAYRIAFVMPSKYSLETLPRPENPAVVLRQVDKCTAAVLRFSGYATEGRTKDKEAQLLELMNQDGRTPAGPPRLAQYNPPWTPPFVRRNEVLLPLRCGTPSGEGTGGAPTSEGRPKPDP